MTTSVNNGELCRSDVAREVKLGDYINISTQTLTLPLTPL